MKFIIAEAFMAETPFLLPVGLVEASEEEGPGPPAWSLYIYIWKLENALKISKNNNIIVLMH